MGYARRFSRKGWGAGKGRDKVCKCIGYHDPLLEEEYQNGDRGTGSRQGKDMLGCGKHQVNELLLVSLSACKEVVLIIVVVLVVVMAVVLGNKEGSRIKRWREGYAGT